MKRLFIVCLTILVAAIAANTAFAASGTFSNPILVGGDEPNPAADQKTTQATSLEFLRHPQSQPPAKNFILPDGKIVPDDMDPIFVDDLADSPGVAGGDVSTPSPMLEHPTSRFGFDPVHPIGPEDLDLRFEDHSFSPIHSWEYKFFFEYTLFRNKKSHRLILGDIREENPVGEFSTLFGGALPLEEVLIGGVLTPLIGNADEGAGPYDTNTYPSTVIAHPTQFPFRWCVVNPPLRSPAQYPCVWPGNKKVSGNLYDSVYVYDLANLGSGLVGPSYDPLNLYVDPIHGRFEYTKCTPLCTTLSAQNSVNQLMVSYYSPLAMFRRVNVAPSDDRYRFSGYSSIEFPKVNCIKKPMFWECKADLWKFFPTNWLIPTATNPISAKAIDLKGVSSTPAFPDTDLAVTYQTTLFNLSKEIPDAFGRPAVFAYGSHQTYRDLLGTCDGPCTPSAFKPITFDRFPDDVMSFVLFHKQQNIWAVGPDGANYVEANPSHIFDVEAWGMIGHGAYDSAVLTDFASDPTKRKQYLLVPSVYSDTTLPPNYAVIYMIDPDGDRLFFKRETLDDTKNFSILNIHLQPASLPAPKPSCTDYDVQFKKTPIILPDVIRVERPADGFVPYQIRTDYIDVGDECADFIVTWRGINTIDDSANPGHTLFDDGNGTMFSDRVTIVLRSFDGAACKIKLPQDFPGGQYDDPHNTPTRINVVDQTNPNPKAQVASAAIGDFDSDGKSDIVAGNYSAEDDTAYAYAYWGGSSIPFDPVDVERFRVGFKQGAGLKGVGMIEADHTELGPDALAQINGRPLTLKEIGCPDYNKAAAADPGVGSIYETYVAIANNLFTQLLNMVGPVFNIPLGTNPGVIGHIDPFDPALPFMDPVNHNKPIPPRCSEKRVCKYGGVTNLPFFEDDPCCLDPCTFNAQIPDKKTWVKRCASYVYAYGHFGRACPLKEYVYLWGDPTKAACDPTNPMWTDNRSPDVELLNRAIAMDDDSGSSDSGETGFSSAWKPDVVMDEASDAIADRKDLIPAQANLERAGTEEERQRLSTLSKIEIKKSDSPFPLANMNIPFRALFGYGIEKAFQGSAEASSMAREMEANEAMADFERYLNETYPNLLIGAPASMEYLFLQPSAALAIASTAMEEGPFEGLGIRSAEKGGGISGRAKSVLGCSLTAPDVIASDSEAISLNKIREKLSAFATWIWDLLVPSAEAACADGIKDTVPYVEDCEDPDPDQGGTDTICKQGPPICILAGQPIICYGPDATAGNPCACNPAKCGDGCYTPALGEQCDTTAYKPPPNYGCPWSKVCDSNCNCVAPAGCGDGNIDPGEECGEPGLSCPGGSYCTGSCKCAPVMQFRVRLPKGVIPPGPREATAVVREGPPKCNYDGTKDAWEECDVAGLSDAAALAQIQAVCPPPPSTDYELDDCDMNDCTCDYKVLPCQQKPGVECTKYSDCGADEICDINCECVPPPGPGPGPGEILTTAYNDCYIHADSFSGDAEAALYKKLNDAVREVTGRTDDLFVEPEQRVIVLCKVGAASAPGIDAADLSLSLSGTPLPGSADNLRPYMVVQTSGSEFIDSGTLVYKSFELVEEPIRILPMEAVDPATQQIKAVVLPSSSLQGVSPMSTSSVMVSGGVMQVNNMIEHRVYNVLPGQEFTIMMGGSAQKIMVAQAQIPDDSGYGIHEFRFITPPDCASWTGVAGYEGCPPIEQRQFDWELVKQALEENKAAMSGQSTSAIYSHLPWELNLNYNFGLVQEVYSKAGDPVPEPVELPFAYLAGQPTMMGKGGGCSCNISSGGQGMRAMLPYLLWLIIPAVVIGFGRMRKTSYN